MKNSVRGFDVVEGFDYGNSVVPKGALPKGMSDSQAAHLLAAAITGVKKTCRTSAELREKIHALITMMVRT